MIWNLRLVSLVFVPFVIEIQSRSTNLPLKIHWPSYYFLVSSYFLVSHMLHLSIQPQTIDQNIIHTGLVWESGVLCTPYQDMDSIRSFYSFHFLEGLLCQKILEVVSIYRLYIVVYRKDAYIVSRGSYKKAKKQNRLLNQSSGKSNLIQM